MSPPRPSALWRALGLCAARDRDHGFEVLDNLAPSLREGARAAALELLEDPRRDVQGRLVEDLAEMLALDRERLRKHWERAPGDVRPLVGLRRVLASKMPAGRSTGELPPPFSLFTGDDLFPSLTKLSSVVLQGAAVGEKWARVAATIAHESCSETSARLAPAVACLALALSDDEGTGDSLSAAWPDALGLSLERCRVRVWCSRNLEPEIQRKCLEIVKGEQEDHG